MSNKSGASELEEPVSIIYFLFKNFDYQVFCSMGLMSCDPLFIIPVQKKKHNFALIPFIFIFFTHLLK